MPTATQTVSLTNEERAELTARSSIIDIHRRTTLLLESERNLYMNQLLISKGLDPAKEYRVGPDGSLTEAPNG